MNTQTFNIKPEVALAALATYKQHRNTHDKRDWEIEKIYRAISDLTAVELSVLRAYA